MILSMTGYGVATAQNETVSVAVEIRTVNHRFLDLHVRVPREYQFLETEISPLIRSVLDRGRVDVGITVKNSEKDAFRIDTELLHRYLEFVNRLYAAHTSSLPEVGHGSEGMRKPVPDMVAMLGLPGVLQNNNDTSTEFVAAISDLAKQSVKGALDSVVAMRRQEGEALRNDMLQNLASIEDSSSEIRKLSINVPAAYQEKLLLRLDQLLAQGSVDPQRLAQEVAILADKCDISEELTRMASHINQYRALIEAREKTGKKLDFLLQEMQREANTILSKATVLEITHCGIAIKTDIEKLREQVQNVE